MSRLLLVEDDPAIAESLSIALVALGHSARTVASGEAGLALLTERGADFDLAVVDVMLPGIDGFELCRQISVTETVPVIMLTARSDPIDVVVGLECGADDYVIKPVEPRVLDARIKTVLRRTMPAPTGPSRLTLGAGVVLDEAALVVTKDDAQVHLTPTELRLLLELTRHRGQVMTRRSLLERVWEYGYAGDTRLVDATVQRLRAKIETDPSRPVLIHTLRGIGYRMDSA